MSMQQAQDALTRVLTMVLRAVAVAVLGIGAAIIVTMDASSSTQGGRYYVAVAAIGALWIIDSQLGRLMRRRLLWSITIQPEERRYHLWSYLLLIAASLFLLGLAHYKTIG